MLKLLAAALLFSVNSFAQYPSMTDYVIAGVNTVNFKYDNCGINPNCYSNQDKTVTEVPPWIIGGGWRSYFFVDGRKTYIWSSPKSIVDNSTIDLKNDATGPYNATWPYMLDAGFSRTLNVQNWKRNYHAIYTAQYITHNVQGGVSIGFCHGENKNEIVGSNCSDPNSQFQNTIQSNVPINCAVHDTWSGGNPYADGWDAYNGILSAVWVNNNQQTNWGQQFFTNELGPIAWPSMAYVTTGNIKTTNGLRHPSSILYNDNIYIFYVEAGIYKGWTPSVEGRVGGVKVVRVAKDNSLNASQYQTYYKDVNGTVSWNPSLPAGFTKDNMLAYVAVPGPKSSDVLNDNTVTSDPVRFSVARVKNTNYFIGVEEYHNWGSSSYYLAIRYSSNLVDWTERQIVYGASDWSGFRVHYPIFLDKTGWSNSEVDLDDFYILGTEGINKSVNKLHIYKFVPPPPPPPPPPPLECPPGISCEARTPVQSPGNTKGKPQFTLQVSPNPVADNMTLTVQVEKPLRTSIKLYNGEGQLLRILADETIGRQLTKTFNLSVLSPGVYFIEVVHNDQRSVRTIVKK